MAKIDIKRQALRHYIDFLVAITKRQIIAQYKHAFFGFLWAIIGPVLHMLVIGFIFSLFIKIPNYYLFLLSGLLPWKFFSKSLSSTVTSFIDERHLLQKSKFPLETIPLSILLSNFLQLIIALILLVVLLAVTGLLVLPNIFLLIPASLLLFVFTSGGALLLSSLQVRYRDVAFVIQSSLLLWFYLTPIVYSLELIPLHLQFLYTFNPLTIILELFHIAVMGQGLLTTNIVLVNLLIITIVVVLGIMIFRKEKKYIVDWL
jgi:ABC-2 type transport system permease protein